MAEKTTEDYDGTNMSSRVQAALTAALDCDPSEIGPGGKRNPYLNYGPTPAVTIGSNGNPGGDSKLNASMSSNESSVYNNNIKKMMNTSSGVGGKGSAGVTSPYREDYRPASAAPGNKKK